MPRSSGTSASPASTISCGGQVGEVDAAERDARARHVRDHAAQRLQAGRLAGAVGAQHDDDLAAAHR